ncbi:MAG: ATP-binding protein [Gaiellales bacterium]
MATVDRASPEHHRLIERDEPLAALQGALSEVRTGQGRLVLVAGEAGVGKTSLVRAFCSRTGGPSSVLQGACEPLATPRPLAPFAGIAPGAAGSHEAWDAVCDELERMGAALVLEDLHWADEASLDVVRMLGRRIEGVPALVIATYRDDALERTHPLHVLLGDLAGCPGVTRMRLELLSPGAVTRLAAGHDVDAAALYRLTSGNPFYVTEVLDAGGEAIPATVADAVRARMARVGEPAMAVLAAVAVAPPHLEPWLLERVCGESLDAVAECFAVGMLVEDGAGVAYRHELARLTVEQGLPPTHRRALHRTLLEVLEDAPAGPDLARLAHHAEGAGDAEAVLRLAPAAGDRAAAVGAYREAASQYARALRFAGGLASDVRADLLQRRSDALYMTDDQAESIVALREAIACYEESGDVVREAGALSTVVSRLACRGHMDEARASANRALGLLEPDGPSRERAAAHAAVALLGLYCDELDSAISSGMRAAELARTADDDHILVDALTCAGTGMFLRDGPAGVGMLEDALRLARDKGLDADIPHLLNNLAGVATLYRSHEMAERYVEEALDHCLEADLDLWRLSVLSTKTRLDLNRGRWTAATDVAEVLVNDPRDSPGPTFAGRLVLALVRARRGDPGVHEVLAQAIESEYPQDELDWVGELAAAQAEVAWLEGCGEQIDELTARAFELARARTAPWTRGQLACWRRRAGIGDPAVEGVAEPYALELDGRYEEAAAAWRGLDSPYEAAFVLGLADDPGSLRRAHAELRELGAAPAAALVARRLRERGVLGVARGPRRSTQENPANLTARELDVLSLVAQGLANTEIADRLFLSPRTVDHHVSSILRKLDVPSRARASVEAARLGIPLSAG